MEVVEGADPFSVPLSSHGGNNLLWINEKPTPDISSPQKIRYLPNEIKIYKTGGKRTASALCSFRGKQQEEKSKDASKNHLQSESIEVFGSKREGTEIKRYPSTSTCSTFTCSETGGDLHHNMDDVMSTVSDVSDLSVMSLTSSHLDVGGLFRHDRYPMNNKTRLFKRTQIVNDKFNPPNTFVYTHEKG